jgi:hypothetical protein
MPEKVGTPPLLGSADVPLGPGPTWHRPRVTVLPVVVSINMLSERLQRATPGFAKSSKFPIGMNVTRGPCGH